MAKNTTVRLDNEVIRKLDALAETLDRSRDWAIKEAIKQYIEHQDWILQQIDEDRIRQSTERLAPVQETERPGRLSETREVIVSGLPYIVTYRIKANRLELLDVRHVSRQ